MALFIFNQSTVELCISLFYVFNKDPPPSKQIMQGCNICTANYLTASHQYNTRIFTQPLSAVLTIHLVQEQFLKIPYLNKSQLVSSEHKTFTSFKKGCNKAALYSFCVHRRCLVFKVLPHPRTRSFSFTQTTYTSSPAWRNIRCQPFQWDTWACKLTALPPLLIQ